MARDVAAWLTRKGVFGRTVTLKIRYSDFTTLTRSHSEPRASQNADAIAARALALLEKTEAGRRPVRLLGVSVHNLQEVEETATAGRDMERRGCRLTGSEHDRLDGWRLGGRGWRPATRTRMIGR